MHTSSHRFRSLIAILIASLAGIDASALLVPLSQARSIAAEGSADGIGFSDAASAADFDPFDEVVQVSYLADLAFTDSLAEQESSIAPSRASRSRSSSRLRSSGISRPRWTGCPGEAPSICTSS